MPRARLEEAVTELERALEWDPLSAGARTMLAVVLLLWRRFDRAMEQARLLLDLEPNAYWAYLVIGGCHRDRGMFDEAIAAHRRANELSGGSALTLGWLGLSLGLGGHAAELRTLLARLHEMAAARYVAPTSFAWIHLGLGEIDSALEWLDQAIDARDQLIMAIKSYAFFDALRSDPRYTALLRRMHLEPTANCKLPIPDSQLPTPNSQTV